MMRALLLALALFGTVSAFYEPLPGYGAPGPGGMLTRNDTSIVGCTNSGYTGSGPCVRKDDAVLTGVTKAETLWVNTASIPELPWIQPKMNMVGAARISGTGTCIGVNCVPTTARPLTVSGVDSVSEIGFWSTVHGAIGIDLHPEFYHKAADTIGGKRVVKIALWIDPSGPNGESMFNCPPGFPCDSAGIVNNAPTILRQYAVIQGNVIGLENGQRSPNQPFLSGSPLWVLGVGDFNNKAPAALFDIGNGSAASLFGFISYPKLANTATGANTHVEHFSADFGLSSISTVSNTTTTVGGIRVQNPVEDGNTIAANKVGIQINAISGGGTNWGLTSVTGIKIDGSSIFRGDANWLATSDYSIAGNLGSAIRFSMGATTGNSTYGIMQALNNGNSTLGNLAIQPYGGNMDVGATTTLGFNLGVTGTFGVVGATTLNGAVNLTGIASCVGGGARFVKVDNAGALSCAP